MQGVLCRWVLVVGDWSCQDLPHSGCTHSLTTYQVGVCSPVGAASVSCVQAPPTRAYQSAVLSGREVLRLGPECPEGQDAGVQ